MDLLHTQRERERERERDETDMGGWVRQKGRLGRMGMSGTFRERERERKSGFMDVQSHLRITVHIK